MTGSGQLQGSAKKLNIVLSKKKFAIGTELPFAGLIVSAKGVKPDPVRIVALLEFPTPKDITVVRSFLGLANQLSGFIPDLAHMTVKLRESTSKKNAFLWLDDHQKEFEDFKTLLTFDRIVAHFDPSLPVVILTDASRLHGIGYAMGHYIDGRFRLLACGSKALTPTQRHFATIVLECLAVQYAIDKGSFYVKGGPEFTVATDHKPLEGIFKKDLFKIPNPRLQRLWEKLVEYSFKVKWVPGMTRHIADALSLAPLFSPEETEDMRVDLSWKKMRVDTARACLATTPGMASELDVILNAVDADYIKLRHDVMNSTETSVYAKQLKSVFSHLSVDDDLVYIDA